MQNERGKKTLLNHGRQRYVDGSTCPHVHGQHFYLLRIYSRHIHGKQQRNIRTFEQRSQVPAQELPRTWGVNTYRYTPVTTATFANTNIDRPHRQHRLLLVSSNQNKTKSGTTANSTTTTTTTTVDNTRSTPNTPAVPSACNRSPGPSRE